jgi:hypothetical protein
MRGTDGSGFDTHREMTSAATKASAVAKAMAGQAKTQSEFKI